MYLFIYLFIYVCVYVCMCVCMYVCVCVYLSMYVLCMCACTYVRKPAVINTRPTGVSPMKTNTFRKRIKNVLTRKGIQVRIECK